jgi:ribonuclease D
MMLTTFSENVTIVENPTTEDIAALDAAFLDKKELVLDVEGVDLGRDGNLSLVSIATRQHCYLFDILECSQQDAIIDLLRKLLQDDSKTKIIHDCRMDSDALENIAEIKLANVHDTSCFHAVLTGSNEINLNDLLAYHKIGVNVVRDGSVYKQNHAFWAERPLTNKMKEWAANDVLKLFQVYDLQKEMAEKMAKMPACLEMCEQYRTFALNCKVKEIKVKNVGRFIGKQGSTIRALRTRTKTCIYPRGVRSESKYLVYYKDEIALKQVELAAR